MDPDFDFQKNLYEHHLRANPQELLVGWYSTGQKIDDDSVRIHDFYWKELGSSPIHLTVDPLDLLSIKACVASPLSLSSFGDKALGFVFQPVELEFATQLYERTGIDLLVKQKKLEKELSWKN
eukprot:TRINITY_DN1786_c0_g1_i1.p1 TRINITY_DN1786_c0_g1~~TRINITY_DN1786_c0_g1_i1.p1  ORF type:complete len:123 (-),score=26.14 TRINITY_DN1786_c0_g1_i1:373-741(-)